MSRRFLASALLAVASLLVSAAPVLALDGTDDVVPCYCRYKADGGAPLSDAEEKMYCAGEVGFINFVDRNPFTEEADCRQVCADNGGMLYVDTANAPSASSYGQRGNMVKDEPTFCVFSHFDSNHAQGQSMQIDGWSSSYGNCKNALQAITGTLPAACNYCFCKYKSTAGACGGKTVYVHPTDSANVAHCPLLCGQLGFDSDGPAIAQYDGKCDYKVSDCTKPANGGSGACKAAMDAIQTAKENADLLKQRVTTRGSVVTMPLPLSSASIPGVIGRIINTVVGTVGAIALMMFVWGGLQWMLAAGSTDKVAKAKKTIVWATLGLVAIFSSYAVLNFVISALK